MDDLIIEKTKFTLAVAFSASTGVLEMEGSSYPEHAFEFFTPIFEWLQRYVEQGPRPVQLTVLFDYLNTSSLKCIIDLFKLLESHAQTGAEVAVHWRYQIDDEDMLEAGREFAEDIQIPIHFHPV